MLVVVVPVGLDYGGRVVAEVVVVVVVVRKVGRWSWRLKPLLREFSNLEV